jgi:hypothetical protein
MAVRRDSVIHRSRLPIDARAWRIRTRRQWYSGIILVCLIAGLTRAERAGPTTQESSALMASTNAADNAAAQAAEATSHVETLKRSVDARAAAVLTALAVSNPDYQQKKQRLTELHDQLQTSSHDPAIAKAWIELRNEVTKTEQAALAQDTEYAAITQQLKGASADKVRTLADAATAKKQLNQATDVLNRAVSEREARRRAEKIVSVGMTRADVEELWGSASSSDSGSTGQTVCIYSEYDWKEETPTAVRYHAVEGNAHNIAFGTKSSPALVKKLIRQLRAVYANGVLSDFNLTKLSN